MIIYYWLYYYMNVLHYIISDILLYLHSSLVKIMFIQPSVLGRQGFFGIFIRTIFSCTLNSVKGAKKECGKKGAVKRNTVKNT